MASNLYQMDQQSAAEKAVSVIGYGYDLSKDIRLSGCLPGPSGSGLIELDSAASRDLVFPGGVVVKNVPNSIKYDKGERTRFHSDVLSFSQMSEKFNQDLSFSGKIPSGLFNAMFDFKGCWQKDATAAKNLAFDGWFITLYNVELEKTNITLSERVKQEVPTTWDPAAFAEFIEKYGTHVVVGVKMGGKDVIHVKQLQNSKLQPNEVSKTLKQLADERFSENIATPQFSEKPKEFKPYIPWELQGVLAGSTRPPVVTCSKNNDTMNIYIRRGGIDFGQSHSQWLSTISQSPNVISMAFVPITSLLSDARGNGFLSHAVNLYLRYKPQIEELHVFLEFQLPRQWAPVYGDLPLSLKRRKQASPSLQFTFMGPKLYVNTARVDTGNRPVTGIRLYLEGKKSDQLAIHLQHLSTLPTTLQLSDDLSYESIDEPERGYLEPVEWSIFSHVCTAPQHYSGSHFDDMAPIVTKAWFEVKVVGMRKVLFLRLGFSMVTSARIRRSEWDGPSTQSRKSGIFSLLISRRFSSGLNQSVKSSKVEINSAVFPGGPPSPPKAPRMTNFVDTKEIVRGPEDTPGYWVVTGAKLCVEGGRISIRAKYTLVTIMSEESMMLM
ncbi:MACPF domain-containing protein NSL1 [Hibiscus syriacus]|uniref:MACPF domain-containing protein NSL1 n=1 Tax=Hibiscus syriacus TaxID=106335 RepID=A0A6A3A7W9_HIBSY|nr:MACPF domain-containing protein NSL1-like [Hibiscus syriacus]KAE8700520.1 MACPF domain-containing protein NSL1 [Hibiscus syriacus]